MASCCCDLNDYPRSRFEFVADTRESPLRSVSLDGCLGFHRLVLTMDVAVRGTVSYVDHYDGACRDAIMRLQMRRLGASRRSAPVFPINDQTARPSA